MKLSFAYLCSGLALLLLTAFVTPPRLKKTTIARNLTMSVPEGFVPLPDDGIATKYPAAHKPLAVFTSPNGRTDLSVTQRPSTFIDGDYELLLKFYKARIQSSYSKVDFLTQEARTINKRGFAALEFVSAVTDSKRGSNLAPIRRYQFVQYTIQGDQQYIFTFNCPVDEQAQWQAAAREIMESIRLK